MKRNIKEEWWRRTVHMRDDVVGLDAAIIMHPKVWEASGHLSGFNDMLVESRTSKRRYRADHLIEEATGMEVEGLSPEELTEIIQSDERIKDPVDGGRDFAPVRPFNLMFETYTGPVKGPENVAYLRPETAQGMFVNFKNVLQTSRVKIPFGIAQVGKSFRNEITPGNFIFRTREFEQMELEYFVELVHLPRPERGEPPPLRTPQGQALPLLQAHRGHRILLPVPRLVGTRRNSQPHRL
jgi:glycyl-tRNA synthetase